MIASVAPACVWRTVVERGPAWLPDENKILVDGPTLGLKIVGFAATRGVEPDTEFV